jgi:flagellar biosynthetic protein FliO
MRALPAVIAALAVLALPAASMAAANGGATTRKATKPSPASTADKPDAKKSSKFEQQPLDLGPSGKQEAKKAAKKGSGGAIWRMILGLLFVLGVIYAVHWLLKNYSKSRFPGMVSSGNGAIEVVATTPLAQGRSLHLVKVGGEVVLIGATEQSITQLRTLDAQQMSDDAGNAGNSEFQQLLQGAMGTSAAPGYTGTTTNVPNQDTFFRRFIGNLQMMTSR